MSCSTVQKGKKKKEKKKRKKKKTAQNVTVPNRFVKNLLRNAVHVCSPQMSHVSSFTERDSPCHYAHRGCSLALGLDAPSLEQVEDIMNNLCW